MDESSISKWLAAAAAGDPDALQRLITRYHPALRQRVAAQMDPAARRHVDPDDVLQNTYIAAFRKVSTTHFDGPGRFYKWLETIALNQLKDQQRALRRQKRNIARRITPVPAATHSYADLLNRVSADVATPSRLVAEHEAVAAMMSSLARLTDEQRAVIRMRFLETRPVAEIAAALGKSEDAVHKLSFRGLKELRRLLVSLSRYLTRL